MCYVDKLVLSKPEAFQFTVNNIDATLCTHIIYSDLTITKNGDINQEDLKNLKELKELRNKNPNLKLMISTDLSKESISNVSDASYSFSVKKLYCSKLALVILKTGFDGFDFRLEDGDSDNLETLKLINQRFGKKPGFVLSVDVAGSITKLSNFNNLKEITDNVDFVNLRTYDFFGNSVRLIHDAPLYASPFGGFKLKLNVVS